MKGCCVWGDLRYNEGMERSILHVDMDAFFASIEQRDHPAWRGRPVIVGAAPDRRGVVSTCSYEARAFGVHSAMPSRQAYALCPEGIFVRPRMARYVEVSEAVFAIFRSVTPFVEGVSVDEAFLDVSGVRRLFGEPEEIARQIKRRVWEELGITCSVGVAHNKFLAKLGSEERKPDGLFVVPEEASALLSWLGEKPIGALWGVGPKLVTQLAAHGFLRVRDIQESTAARLEAFLTSGLAAHLMALAFGRDVRPVETAREEKSYSRETTFSEDTVDVGLLRETVRVLAEDVGRRLREAAVWARTVRLKLRYAGFRTVTRQASLSVPVCDDLALREAAWDLLARHLEADSPVRLIGFGAEQLVDSPSPYDADDLFAHQTGEDHPRAKEERLSHTLDALRRRFGKSIR